MVVSILLPPWARGPQGSWPRCSASFRPRHPAGPSYTPRMLTGGIMRSLHHLCAVTSSIIGLSVSRSADSKSLSIMWSPHHPFHCPEKDSLTSIPYRQGLCNRRARQSGGRCGTGEAYCLGFSQCASISDRASSSFVSVSSSTVTVSLSGLHASTLARPALVLMFFPGEGILCFMERYCSLS